MPVPHLSALTRSHAVAVVCDSFDAVGWSYTITPVPTPLGRWLESGLPAAIERSTAFIHVETEDSFWSSALAQEADLALQHARRAPSYPLIAIRTSSSDASKVWMSHYLPHFVELDFHRNDFIRALHEVVASTDREHGHSR